LQIRCNVRATLWLAGHYMPEKRNKALLEQDSKRNDAIAVIRAPLCHLQKPLRPRANTVYGTGKKYGRLRYRRYRA
jgi:hypothetical protein